MKISLIAKYFISVVLLLITFPLFIRAEDGSRLWLRFPETRQNKNKIESKSKSPTIDIAIQELSSYWQGARVELVVDKKLKQLKDGYKISGSNNKIIILAAKDIGLLYGTYHLLRLQQTKKEFVNLNITEIPSYDFRVLNHWDNIDGSIERGYAGRSIWKWEDLPDKISPRYEEYARANASIGINAAVLNNVNTTPRMLSKEYLEKVKIIANVLRPYGIKVYLTASFSSPQELGGLENSDPLNPKVRDWWKNKAKEIYRNIPDFGGFLVKANSEGISGPQDYGRSHADGANMMAEALAPFKGIVMWRAFVYDPDKDDRAKQAYLEFQPLDGQFHDNVIIQIKNGPVDFQPREPFNPLFGAFRKTPCMIEFQITQEYTGHSNHLFYEAPLFKETLDTDTYSDGKGSTVAKITDGTLRKQKYSAISGVANIGDDENWCGHDFAQANWYCFGRLAWNNELSSDQIAEEWLKMTFTTDSDFVNPIKNMMIESREAVVNYMMPLGLHHIFAEIHHYGPAPWYEEPSRPDWRSVYYHRATKNGIGFDRTTAGSNAVSQYFPPLKDLYNNLETCPEEFLLWFHYIPWDYKMKNGRIFLDELCYKYNTGVQQVREFQKIWDRLETYIDDDRFKAVQSKLKIQSRDAVWWKDACLLYFQTFSGRPIPYDIERPVHDLDDLKKIRLGMSIHS